MKLRRANISDEAEKAVRAMIVDGALPEGERVNEVHLAQKLGVSRTPLREALNRLVAEGALTSVPRLGFYVRPLTLEEVQQIYAIRPLLDPEALRLAGLPSPKQLARLERMNDKLRKLAGQEAAVALDDEWHLALIDECPNRVLIEMIQNTIQRTKRYELALFRENLNVQRATDEHATILAALRKHDLEGACAALKANMQSGLAPIAAWLQQREQKKSRVKR